MARTRGTRQGPGARGAPALNFIGAARRRSSWRRGGGDTELMWVLVQLGADPLTPNEDGTTPLMVAAGVGTQIARRRVRGRVAGPRGEAGDRAWRRRRARSTRTATRRCTVIRSGCCCEGRRRWRSGTRESRGGTPLRIALEFYRGMNFRFHVPTADALRALMIEAACPVTAFTET